MFFKGKAFSPKQLDIELTYSCNLSCEMCPLHLFKLHNKVLEEKNRLKLNDWENILVNFLRHGGKRLTVTGGEPLLYKDFANVLKLGSKLGLKVTMLSNATLINEENAKAIVSSGLKNLITSIDGPSRIHDVIRGNGKLYKTISGLKILSKTKQQLNKSLPDLHASFTVTSTNQNHLYDFLEEIPDGLIKTVSVNRIFYTTNIRLRATKEIAGDNWIKKEDWLLPKKLCELDSDVLKNQINEAKKLAEKKGISIHISPVFNEKHICSQAKYDPPPFSRQCYYPWTSVRIDPIGNVYPCSISLKLGNIKEKKLSDVWNDSPYLHFRRLLQKKNLFPMCSTCCVLTKPEWNILPIKK
ncbi:radical SAM protein [Candidatus Parcubacteria bacterium]|nr:MAG: radical SAM protein [Candidatus Parcubacteria bacterium]